MKTKYKYILITLIFSILVLLSSHINAQDHVIGSQEKYKSELRSYNYNYYAKNNYRQPLNFVESIDSINIPSSSVLNGDSIVMLIGDIPAVIKYMVVKVDTGSSSDPYITTGSTDTTLIYSRYYNSNIPIAMLADTTFSTINGGYTGIPVSTNFTESDSCLFWLKIPSPKYSSGTHTYTLIYNYMKLE